MIVSVNSDNKTLATAINQCNATITNLQNKVSQLEYVNATITNLQNRVSQLEYVNATKVTANDSPALEALSYAIGQIGASAEEVGQALKKFLDKINAYTYRMDQLEYEVGTVKDGIIPVLQADRDYTMNTLIKLEEQQTQQNRAILDAITEAQNKNELGDFHIQLGKDNSFLKEIEIDDSEEDFI